MNRWEYLSTLPFKSRYVLAAYYVRHCDLVVEVGGYKNCVGEFLPVSARVIAIDPLLDLPWLPLVDQRKMNVRDFDLAELEGRTFALVLMGFDICGGEDLGKVIALMQMAKVVVMEYAVGYRPVEDCVGALLSQVGRSVVMTVGLDFTGNKVDVPADSYPTFWKRTMVVME